MALTHILVDFENVQPEAADVALVRDPQHRLWLFRGPNQTRYKADFAEALLALGGRVQVIRCARSGRNALDMHIAFHIGRLVGALGEAAAGAGEAVSFVVVSSDTDYAPVLEYVRSLGFDARSVPGLPQALGQARGGRARKAIAADSGEAAVEKKAQKAPAKAARKAAAKSATAKTAQAKTADKPAAARKEAKAPARHKPAPASAAAPAAAAPSAALLAKLAADLAHHPNSRPTRLAGLRKWLQNRNVVAGEVDATIAELQARGAFTLQQTRVEYS